MTASGTFRPITTSAFTSAIGARGDTAGMSRNDVSDPFRTSAYPQWPFRPRTLAERRYDVRYLRNRDR